MGRPRLSVEPRARDFEAEEFVADLAAKAQLDHVIH